MQSFLQDSELAETTRWTRLGQNWGAAMAGVLEGLCGRPLRLEEVQVEPLAAALAPCLWAEVEGPRAVICMDPAHALDLLALLTGGVVEPGAALDDAQRSVLREAWTALTQALELKVVGLGPLQDGPPPPHVRPGTRIDVRLACEETTIRLRLLCPQTVATASDVMPSVRGGPGDPPNLGVLLDVPLKMLVVLGQARVPLKDLLTVGAGSVLALDRQTAEPLEILVNGKLFGHGEVVVVDEHFAIRILDLVDGAR